MTEFDYLVVGGGISGAAAAAALAARGRTLLAEGETVAGYHSTGRSAALYTPNFGGPVVRALNAAGHDFFTSPPDGFADRPLLTPRGALTIARPDEAVRIDAVLALGTARHPIEPVPEDTAFLMAPILRRELIGAAAFEPGVADMDVAAIHQGFLAALRRQGGVIQLAAPVQALARRQGLWHVTAGAEAWRARILVNAAGAWGDTLAALAGIAPVGLVAKRRTMIAVDAPAAESGMPLVEFAGEEAYFKPDGGRLLVSPGDETPVPPQDILPDEWDIAVAADWLKRHTTHHFTSVRNSWAGLRSFVADQAPVVGFAPECEGFFWLVGQGGYGIMMAPTLARVTAALIAGDGLPPDLVEAGLSPAMLAPDRPALLPGARLAAAQ